MIEGMIAMLAAVVAPAASTPVLHDAAPAAETAPLERLSDRFTAVNDRAMRVTLPASVNGKGPFHFTIDTGADRSALSDRLATTLALPEGKVVIVHGIIGSEPVRTVKVDRLTIGTRERRGIAAPVFTEAALGSNGLLGVDALTGQALVLDFKRRRITMTRSDADRSDPDTIIVVGKSRFGQLILTDAHIGGKKIVAIIDTGAEGSVGNLEMRRLLLGSPTLRPNNSLLGVTGAEIPAENGYIPRMRLGGMTVNNMPLMFADAHTFRKFGVGDVPAILVGMDMLRRFDRVAVDFRRREVRFLIGDGGEAMAAAAKPGERRIASADAAVLAP
jgi:predicted aspartyl protease